MSDANVEEVFDVVDEQDRVIGQAVRSEVHAKRLLHRAVHIFVLRSNGDLILQRRSALKDEYPLRITSSASGHLGAGESYDEAAPRELQEELGIDAPLERLAKFPGGPEMSMEHTVLYLARSDANVVFQASEISEIVVGSPDRISQWIQDNPDDFCPTFRNLFRWFREHLLGGAASRGHEAT